MFLLSLNSALKDRVSYLNQKTVKNSIQFRGIALHTGNIVEISIRPSAPNTGIVFKRIDLKTNNLIYPNYANVSDTFLNTTISNEYGVKVSTIEHLMGALFGLGIDNALIEIDNDEVPILDGSAKEFIEKIILSGFKKSEAPIKIVKINKKVEISDGERFISIEPSILRLDINFELKYNNKLIGNQKNKINVYEDNLSDIFSSRTFCLFEDVEKIRKNGFAKGGSLDNAIVIKDDKILNENGLRNTKEFVNHKILDCIGDLYTCGFRMIGSVVCSQGGHYLTNQLLRKVFKDKENFSILEIQERNLPHTLINKKFLKNIA